MADYPSEIFSIGTIFNPGKNEHLKIEHGNGKVFITTEIFITIQTKPLHQYKQKHFINKDALIR